MAFHAHTWDRLQPLEVLISRLYKNWKIEIIDQQAHKVKTLVDEGIKMASMGI